MLVNRFNNPEPILSLGRDIKAHLNNNRDHLDLPADRIEVTGKHRSLSQDQKNEILHKAKITASGWSVFGMAVSTVYFAFRSDSTIAKKYKLDKNKDKEFIQQIKREQTIATIPAIACAGIFGWLYFKAIENPDHQVI